MFYGIPDYTMMKMSQNVQRQPLYCVRKPPTTGPMTLKVTVSLRVFVGKERFSQGPEEVPC